GRLPELIQGAESTRAPAVLGPVLANDQVGPPPDVGEVLALIRIDVLDRDLGRAGEQPHHEGAAVPGEVIDEDWSEALVRAPSRGRRDGGGCAGRGSRGPVSTEVSEPL